MDHPGGVCVLDVVGTNSGVNIINLWNSVYLPCSEGLWRGLSLKTSRDRSKARNQSLSIENPFRGFKNLLFLDSGNNYSQHPVVDRAPNLCYSLLTEWPWELGMM